MLYIPINPYFLKTNNKLIGKNSTEFGLEENLINIINSDVNIFDLPELPLISNDNYKVMKIVPA